MQNKFYVNADVNLMVENIIQNKIRIIIVVNMNVKKTATIKHHVCEEDYAWKIMPGKYTRA